MVNSFNFYKKHFKQINIIYLVLSIASFVIPFSLYIHVDDWKISFAFPFYMFANLNSEYVDWIILSAILLVIYLILFITALLNCILSYKKQKDYQAIILPPIFSLFCYYSWYLFNPATISIPYFIPFLGYFLCMALMLYSLIIVVRSITINFIKKHPPRPHKPTKAERIAELERQVAELKGKERDAD